jgi:copper oxidase (laccase) domain-containing protein
MLPYFWGMGRPATATEKRTSRVVPVTFASVAEKQAAQAHAGRKGQSLAGLLKLLLAADMAPTGPRGTAGA